jgi:prevent-host-death family protein
MYNARMVKRTDRSVERVGIADFRRDLKKYLEAAASGDEVVVTDHGTPMVRLTGIDSVPIMEELYRSGVVTPPRSAEPFDPATVVPIHAEGDVSGLISIQRD